MNLSTLHPLKQHLFDAYGGFADKRIKNLDKGDLFIVDDRGRSDFDARKCLFNWFCTIFVRVESPDEVRVILGSSCPRSDAVNAWMKANAEEVSPSPAFTVSLGNIAPLRDLAKRIADIVRPGAPRYPAASYKYVCPRTAKSLTELAAVLESYEAV